MVRETLVAGLLGGNSRSFTLIFVARFSVLLFCFDGQTIKHSDVQSVSYSCSLVRYLRARVTLLRNLPKFWRFKNRDCHKKGPKMNKLTFCLFLVFRCAKVIKIIQFNRSLAILFWQKIGGSQKNLLSPSLKRKLNLLTQASAPWKVGRFSTCKKLNLLTIVELTLTLMTNTPLRSRKVRERGVCKIS